MKLFTELTNIEKKLINGGIGCTCVCTDRRVPLEIDHGSYTTIDQVANFKFIGPVRSPAICNIKCITDFFNSDCSDTSRISISSGMQIESSESFTQDDLTQLKVSYYLE